MTEHNDYYKAMLFEGPEYIPVRMGLLPAVWMKHREKLDELVVRHPIIFGEGAGKNTDYDAVHGTYAQGDHVDPWGCVWSNVAHGMESIVTVHPVPTRADVHTLKAPTERTGFPHGFMYLRLCDLRGFEEMMIDFAEEPPELRMLIDIVLEHNVKELEHTIEEVGPCDRIVHFGDDLGMQNGLAMGPVRWRRYLKPCFAKLYGRCHEMGWYVYMHSDGDIKEIIPDLIECGVNVINPQIRANGLDNLVDVCKGKVCVNLDLDRQLFPFCKPEEIDAHVRETVEKLGSPEGGLMLSAECGPDVPLDTIEAICVALEKYRAYFK